MRAVLLDIDSCVWLSFRRIAVVTSDFHMPRTEAIFRHCSKLASAWEGDKDWSVPVVMPDPACTHTS